MSIAKALRPLAVIPPIIAAGFVIKTTKEALIDKFTKNKGKFNKQWYRVIK